MSKTEYYPYGMKIDDLSYSAAGARYGYNSQEQSTELNLDGNHTTAEFWEYDARSARRWNLDPVVKHHTSGYNTFASNPIWFTDMNGADSSLYSSNTGKFINRGITPEDDKTAVWRVDDQAKDYDKNNPWATAFPLEYNMPSTESENNKISGEFFRSDHPMRKKGWHRGKQVYEEELLDLGREFYNIINNEKEFFRKISDTKNTNWFQRLNIFESLVNTDGPYDLKSTTRSNIDKIPSFAFSNIGEYSLMGGYLLKYDDYGNLAYGAWGKAFGYSRQELLDAADLAQKLSNITSFKGWVGDPERDRTMIKIGFAIFGK